MRPDGVAPTITEMVGAGLATCLDTAQDQAGPAQALDAPSSPESRRRSQTACSPKQTPATCPTRSTSLLLLPMRMGSRHPFHRGWRRFLNRTRSTSKTESRREPSMQDQSDPAYWRAWRLPWLSESAQRLRTKSTTESVQPWMRSGSAGVICSQHFWSCGIKIQKFRSEWPSLRRSTEKRPSGGSTCNGSPNRDKAFVYSGQFLAGQVPRSRRLNPSVVYG